MLTVIPTVLTHLFIYLHLFIFAFYKSIKGKPVGYRTSQMLTEE